MSERLTKLLGTRLKRHEPLAKYTAARMGGSTDWLYLANGRNMLDEMIQVVKIAWEEAIPVRVLGGGANILVSDLGFRGLIVVNRVSDVEFGEWHDGRAVSATSGTGLTALGRMCQARGLSGLEWASSVPGTVGGAVVNNAGAHGSDMSKCIGDVVVLEAEKGPQFYSAADLKYAYRTSVLKSRTDKRFLVLLATFILQKDDPDVIQQRIHEFTEYRKKTQPPGASLGSIFKNPPGDYAGRLIDSCGLKGFRIGNALVSPLHANFFINDGHATADHYYQLIRHVQRVVVDKTGVLLELEVEILGEWDRAEL